MTNRSKHNVFFTGASASSESGLHTFRDAGERWGKFPVSKVAT